MRWLKLKKLEGHNYKSCGVEYLSKLSRSNAKYESTHLQANETVSLGILATNVILKQWQKFAKILKPKQDKYLIEFIKRSHQRKVFKSSFRPVMPGLLHWTEAYVLSCDSWLSERSLVLKYTSDLSAWIYPSHLKCHYDKFLSLIHNFSIISTVLWLVKCNIVGNFKLQFCFSEPGFKGEIIS